MQQKIYFVLKDNDKYWTGWHWCTNIKSAKKYISKDDFLEDIQSHSFELDGQSNGILLEVKESIEILNEHPISWKTK